MANQELSLIKSEERTQDGNILPEVRERVLQEIKTYLQQAGYLNVSEISSKLGLSRQTTRRLVDEIISMWRDEQENQIIIQRKWHLEVVKEINENPDTFSREKIDLIKLKSSLLSKVNTLSKALIK